MVTMNVVLKQQAIDDLRQRFADVFGRRGRLAAGRKDGDAAAANEQIKRLDADIEVLCRDLYAAERSLRTTP
jgi:hypothetical protein